MLQYQLMKSIIPVNKIMKFQVVDIQRKANNHVITMKKHNDTGKAENNNDNNNSENNNNNNNNNNFKENNGLIFCLF